MKKSVQDLSMHDHTCLAFSNQVEFFHCAIPFLREGINNNEKCYLILDDITREEAIRNFKYIFKEQAFDLQKTLSYITIENMRNIYLPDNKFIMERTRDLYLSTIKKTIAEEGYTGLRAFVELSSTLKKSMNLEEFQIWEKYADQYFKDNKFLAVCAYNKKLFPDEYISKVVNVHPIEIDIINTRL